MDLREQLQTSLGSAYTIERELGGGGMSRVFVAEERAFGRKVVVKVLPPELTAGLSVSRFKREIQLAAQLQHPHIVPVHSAGEMEGLPYYTMPFVEGTSLRALLAHGPLPIGETVNILREVAKALAYAHDHGVVHRDIKPDNVLITGGSAVVTDFGIAKALSAAKGDEPGGPLTRTGTSMGTPMYMAPEQAAGDPSTDHRADVYAFGCMAYEMLTGAPPFAGKAPQKLLASHMVEMPRPVTDIRPDTPPLLAELVMQCLEKEPDNRPQTAAALAGVLEGVTISGGAHATMPSFLLGGRPRVARALIVYAAAFVCVWIVAKAAVVLGLPTWVVPGTLIVMALGLPVILLTAFVHRSAHAAMMTTAALTQSGTVAETRSSAVTRLAVKASPWITWRRATLGGVTALGAFALLVVGYMIMRTLGIGPVASLRAMGTFSDSERVLVADFKSPAADTSLGPVVTEMFRSDLADSKNLIVIQPTAMRQVLQRMQRSPNEHVDLALAREIATSEGVKAVIDGEVLSLAGSYVITATLYATQTGNELARFRATAKDSNAIIGAIDDLSRDVRTKAGESLRNVNAAMSLEQVTTPSFEAFKKYVQGVRAFRSASGYDRGIALLEDAVSIDTGFSMAWRKMAIEIANRVGHNDRSVAAIEKAYAHRDRLSELERDLTIAAYYNYGPKNDDAKSLAAYEAALEVAPRNASVLNNLAISYVFRRNGSKAEQMMRRAAAEDTGSRTARTNLLEILIGEGKLPEADSFAKTLAGRFPDEPALVLLRSRLAALEGLYDSADALRKDFDREHVEERSVHRLMIKAIGYQAAMHGRVREASRLRHALPSLDATLGDPAEPLTQAVVDAMLTAYFSGDKRKALKSLDSSLALHSVDALPPLARPLSLLAEAYAIVGRPDKVRTIIAKFDERRGQISIPLDGASRNFLRGQLAMAESRYADAASAFQASDSGDCTDCALPYIAHAYDLAGMPDSAIAVFTRYTSSTDPHTSNDVRMTTVNWFFAGAHKRLGELLAAKGDLKGAASHYEKFIELWKGADPELQPKVAEVRKRLEQIRAREAK